ncbi:doublecortin domain-containing protein 2-like isoform X16 [Mercenaria mercenaria]|uniref:doublecortin domain-containing protein 2-like isoform X16 n=1 Tax=Mercenaria mercenaria TaxID=6596 RepID=UPI00234E7205|nr:doublecortin domain-containing protein 2-like isoform X16 [Mercenaria mercenaria]
MAAKGHSKQRLPNGYISNKGGHDAYDARDDFQTSPAYMTPNPKVLSVRVHVNRDKFEPGKKMVIAKHKLKTFENFLNECTDKCKPYFGSARRLYTARGRHRIQSLEELNQDSIYVITGNEQFEHVNYREIPDRPRQPRRKGFKKIDYERIIHPVTHAWDEKLRKEPGRSQDLNRHNIGLRLRVHKNGENTEAYHPVTILPRDKDNFSRIAEEISTAMGLPPIKQIYKIINLGGVRENFIPVTEAKELEQQEHLLVIPRTGFGKELNVKVYPFDGMNPFYVLTSPRIGPYWNYPSFQSDKPQTRHNRNLNPHKVVPSIGSSKQSDTMSPFSNPPGSQGERRGNKPKRGRGRREVDYDKDEGGVYRAKNQNNAKGAHQVNESRETRTEKPIDQTEAEIVEEERVDEDAAAAKIQAGARAYKARKEYKEKKEAQRRDMNNESDRLDDEARRREEEALRNEEEERRQENAHWQAEQDRQREEEEARWQAEQEREREMNAQKKKMDEDQAATRIQASFKGHKARKEYQAKKQTQVRVDDNKQSKSEKEIEAATKIQSGFRGYKVRKEYNSRKKQIKETDINDNEKKDIDDDNVGKKTMNEDDAAVAIQAGFKGYKTRKEFAQKKAQAKAENEESRVENKMDIDKKQHEAATQIQANFRGFRARKQYTEKKKNAKVEAESATRIQASFRGFRARKELSEKKKEPQLPDQAPSPKGDDEEAKNRAATKIQSGFRGYKARKDYKAKDSQVINM